MRAIQKLEDEKTMQELFEKPKVLLFKNSMRCGISRNARGHVEQYAARCTDEVEIYMVDVINERELSNKIEIVTKIPHESPQAIYMEKGIVIWHASHFQITEKEIHKAVAH